MNTISAFTMRCLLKAIDEAINHNRNARTLPGYYMSQVPEATGLMIYVRDALLEASLADVAVQPARVTDRDGGPQPVAVSLEGALASLGTVVRAHDAELADAA